MREFKDNEEVVSVAIKHTNPCGVGLGKDSLEAYTKCYEADKVSIFGGIVGINFHHPFVMEKGDYLSSLLSHIEHFLSLGGEKTVCIGSDFDGADIDSSLDSIEKITTLVDAMKTANYSDDLINDIMFNNAMHFFERL
mgnify:CR=1 FL=1